MKPEDIIKATRNSLNIYSFTAETLEKLITAIQSEHKCQTCEALARTVMMDQTSHDTHNAAPAPEERKRQWADIDIDKLSILAGFDPSHKGELGLVRSVVRTILRGEE